MSETIKAVEATRDSVWNLHSTHVGDKVVLNGVIEEMLPVSRMSDLEVLAYAFDRCGVSYYVQEDGSVWLHRQGEYDNDTWVCSFDTSGKAKE